MSPLRLACLVLALLCCAALAASPAAAQPANVTFVKYARLAKALHERPFDPKLRDTLVDNLKHAMSMYAFLDLSKNSAIGAPTGAKFTDMSYDVIAALDAVKQTVYSSDFAMNTALTNVFAPLNDAHTQYHKNQYNGVAFALPMKLISAGPAVTDAAVQLLFIDDTAKGFAIYEKVYGYSPLANLTAIGGGPLPTNVDQFEITKIDGVDAVSALKLIAQDLDPDFRTSVSKDANTRFNLLVNGYGVDPQGPPGGFSYRPMRQFDIPRQQVITFTLQDPISQQLYELPLQWLGMVPSENGLDASVFPQPKPKKDAMLREKQIADFWWSIHSLQHPALWRERDFYLGTGETAAPLHAEPLLKAGEKMIVNGNDYSIPGEVSFSIPNDADNTNVGVLQIFNFEPVVTADFINLIVTAVSNHQQKLNGTRLLIDLRSNGGGDICLGYAIIRFLFPAIVQPSYSFDASDSPFGRYDTVTAPLTQALADLGAQSLRDYPAGNICNFFTPCAWINPATQTRYANEAWYDSGRMLNRGGVTRQYTALFHDSCTTYFEQLPPSNINPGYAADQVAMVSDGMCGSTCSVFSSFIQEHQLAKSVFVGGIIQKPTLPAQFWSFPGGQVIEMNELQAIAVSYGLAANDSRIPQPPANGASQTFAFREIYAWSDMEGVYPLEFLSVPADLHVPYVLDFLHGPNFWEAIISLFDIFDERRCAEGVTNNPCTIANGQGQQACSNGKIVPDLCAVTGCDAGYFADAANAKCSPCAAGFYRGAIDAACTACPVVPIAMTFTNPASSANAPCTQVYSPAAVSSACPFSVQCGAATGDDSGKVSKSTLIAVAVVLSLLIVILVIVIVVLKRSAGQRDSLGVTLM